MYRIKLWLKIGLHAAVSQLLAPLLNQDMIWLPVLLPAYFTVLPIPSCHTNLPLLICQTWMQVYECKRLCVLGSQQASLGPNQSSPSQHLKIFRLELKCSRAYLRTINCQRPGQWVGQWTEMWQIAYYRQVLRPGCKAPYASNTCCSGWQSDDEN